MSSLAVGATIAFAIFRRPQLTGGTRASGDRMHFPCPVRFEAKNEIDYLVGGHSQGFSVGPAADRR